MTDYHFPGRMPASVRMPFNGTPWVALTHSSAGPDIRDTDASPDDIDEDYIEALAAACTDVDWEAMADLAMSFDTDPTPEGRPNVATVFRNAAGDVTYSDPTGSLALSTSWHESNEQLASLGVQKAGAAERLGRYGYDPLDGSYEDRPTDDGLRAIPDSGAAARAQLVEAARESQYLPSAAHQTRSENFNRTTVAPPAAYMHGDGSPIIGRDGQPLWRERHDLEPEPEFATDQAAFDATDDSREALANEQLRMLGLR
jgi:hypothetical protein